MQNRQTQGLLDRLFGQSREKSMFKAAANTVSTALMIADNDLNIVFMNDSVKSFMQSAEGVMRKDVPNFNLGTLFGSNIDQYHKNPMHQRNMLKALTTTYRTSISVGGKHFHLKADPIFDEDGTRLGTMVEWSLDADMKAQLEAIGKSMGIIEFNLDGTVITANPNFLAVINYSLEEVLGKHHSTFVDPAYAASPEYRAFWEKLNRGEYDAGEYKRIAKGGKEVWIQASYNPIRDANGKVYKVVKYASDITAQKLRTAEYQGQIDAIGKSMGVIEFNLDGTVITANPNFLSIINYSLDEAKGKHHRTFVDPAYAASPEYRAFWEKLNRGEYDAGEYKRIAKGGEEVWIQASYNPIRDASGRVYKVVKYASDVTAQKRYQMEVERVLADTSAVMTALAEGDLTQMMDGQYDGEFAMLSEAVNKSIANLRTIVGQIGTAAELINTASREIAAGNTDLSQRTEEQASSLEETASSMEELASTVKQNAENARQANQMASTASGVAVKGGAVVGEVVTTMSAINESSRKIVDIISVIDGIAFQTNILALNAAVEAARAGEQGRGFAVVAGEVRSLAQRSAAAAKEIKQLISDSVEKVEGGTRLVEEAGKTMDEIVDSVQRVTDIMAEISAASAEQSSGIDQVNQAVMQMDEVTQQNAALVEEAAAAAAALEEQAVGLVEAVSLFRLDGSAAMRAPSALKALPASGSAKKFSLSDAAGAHAKWKARLVNYIKGNSGETLDPKVVSRDDKCDLGCWIHGEGQKYTGMDQYKKLKSLHATFHKQVGKIVETAQAGDQEEAMRMLGGAFFTASNDTIKAINALQTQISGGGKPARSVPELPARSTAMASDEWEEF